MSSKYWSFYDADAKIRRDMDLIDDPAVAEQEMIEYFNDAIREAEANIHGLGFEDDYFLTSEPLNLSSGVDTYALPSNIYANKIRGLIYSEGLSRTYELRPYKRFGKFSNITIDSLTPGDGYGYMYYIKNDTALAQPDVIIVPAPTQSGQLITTWYIRSANRIKQVNDIIDIPEFITFIFAHVKKSILLKKKEFTPDEMNEYNTAKLLMLSTLRQQTADDNDDVAMDISFYKEHA